MPGQILLQANPPADPSQLPDSMLQFSVQLDTKNYLPTEELKSIQMFRRAADYIAAGMFHPRLLQGHIAHNQQR
jgi:xylulose-5-phosphate/fructose-6-phosphate phosphoketolase